MIATDATNRHLGRRTTIAIAVTAIVWFLPGIWWGLPGGTETLVATRWGVDELGPSGALNAIRAILGGGTSLSPQYPLGHYFIQALFVWPYHVAMLAADNLGFGQQTESIGTLALLHRLPVS